ncbi:hypothetical protein G9A89_011611 [Geosiphon pyriformis]|nr:hypothetical protein G9A89_011611 [Geosiphon pyriformis]
MCNVQGINVPAKQENIIYWHRDSGNLVLIITETKLRSSNRFWIRDKFNEVRVFSSGLNKSFFGAGVMIIMNTFLAHYVYKVSEANNINSVIAKAVNESSFVVLGANFWGMAKTINFLFISSNLVNAVVDCEVSDISEFFNTDYCAVYVSFEFKGADENKWNNFKGAMSANAAMFSDEFDTIHKIIVLSANEMFKKKWFKGSDNVFTKESLRFHKLKLLVSKIVRTSHEKSVVNFDSLMRCWISLDNIKTSVVQNIVNSGAGSNYVHSVLFGAKKFYHAAKLAESLRTKETNIRLAINKRMEDFEVNKKHTIKSVLKCPFHKVALDYLMVDDELILESELVKSKYVFDEAFSGVMCLIKFDELVEVVSNLSDGKTAGLSSLLNKLWKLCDKLVLDMLLVFLNSLQQPVEFNSEEYKNESNNSITVQAKSTVNKKPRVLSPTTLSYHQTPQKEYGSLFGNLTPTAGQTEGNPSTWEQPPTQNLAESASPLTKETAILQLIGSSDKGKQPALAPREHSNTQTPIPLNITSNTPPINQIMAYRDIAKLEKFSGEEDNAYSWIADAEKAITANGWNNDRTIQALLIIKQKDHEAVTTYLGQFNQILHQILAIERDYYTMTQVLNQFIKELQSSILRFIRFCYLTSLQDAVTFARNLESNQPPLYAQQVPYTQPPSQNYYQLPPMTQAIPHYQTFPYSPFRPRAIDYNQGWRNSNNNQVQTNSELFMEDQGFDKSTPVEERDIKQISQPSKQTKSNILPATITEDTTLTAIFLFNIDNLNTHSLFSRAAINQDKSIMALYTDAKVGGIDIKLILDSRSAGSIITKQLIDQLGCRVDHATTVRIITADGNTKTLIEEIDNFSFEINGIQISTKVFVMEAIQYQALVENDWLSKANATLDWNTQELQLMFNGQHAQVPATCGHFKTQCTKEPLIEFEDILMPPTIETYQKNLDDQNDKASGTTRHASYMAKSCQMKDSGMMCLAEEEHATRLELAPIRKEQKQRLADLNTKLCNHCLIPCHFQYCDECDLMFNLPPRVLFPITELPEPEEEVLITEDMLFQDPTEDTKTEHNNKERICPEKMHDTDAGFNLRYPRQSPIIIAPYSLIKIDLKIVLEIPISTMVQVVSRSSLAKKEIDIKGGIIDANYTGNIIVILQNNLDRPYKIESQEKIAQAIFLPLLGLTVQEINRFGSSRRGNIPVNFTEEDSNQVNQKIQDQVLLFEASPEICSLADVANLYLPVKAHKHFKIPIHNPTKDVIEIPKGTLVGSISTDIQNSEKLQSIPDFAQLFLFCDITSQYANVFASKNEFERTDIVKHQIDMEDTRPIKQ